MMASAALETGFAAPPLGISPGDGALVVGGVPAGGGEAKPPDGISPAHTVVESTQASAIAVKNRFMFGFSFEDFEMQDFLHLVRIEQLRKILARAYEGHYYSAC
jgi:hypothetical protein